MSILVRWKESGAPLEYSLGRNKTYSWTALDRPMQPFGSTPHAAKGWTKRGLRVGRGSRRSSGVGIGVGSEQTEKSRHLQPLSAHSKWYYIAKGDIKECSGCGLSMELSDHVQTDYILDV